MQNNQIMDICVLLYNNNNINHQNHGELFIRFACEFEYAKKLLPDEGSLLLSGCALMKIIFSDRKGQLHSRMRVEYEACPAVAHHIHGRGEILSNQKLNGEEF